MRRWREPMAIGKYVADLLTMKTNIWPPALPGVYIVSEKKWSRKPSCKAEILYVGATGLLLDRIGNLIRDMLGFYGWTPDESHWVGAHSGGQSLWEFCNTEKIQPGDLFLSWATTSTPCHWCAEKKLADTLAPKLGRRRGRSTCLCSN